jgi:hypothetical protein
MKYRSNREKIIRELGQAFRNTTKELDKGYRDLFNKPFWNWNGTTKRSSGRTVGSPRNVVDTGELRDSQDFQTTSNSPTRIRVRFSWRSEHALPVFLGVTYKNGHVAPARNVPVIGLQLFDLPSRFSEIARDRLSGIK